MERFRLPAWQYCRLVETLQSEGAPLRDQASAFEPLPLVPGLEMTPYPHQQAALSAWLAAGRQVVVGALPPRPHRHPGAPRRHPHQPARAHRPEGYRTSVAALAGTVLAPYRVVRLIVRLSPRERAHYDALMATRNRFIQQCGIRLGSVTGWQAFVRASARSRAGRRTMLAYREVRALAFDTAGKLRVLADLLAERHPARTHKVRRPTGRMVKGTFDERLGGQ
jgi:hypothetical protein